MKYVYIYIYIFIYIKKNYKKVYIKIDLLQDLKSSRLNFSFVMIYVIDKKLALISIFSISIVSMNYLKDNIFECFFKKYNILLVFLKKLRFFITYNDGKPKALRKNEN